MECSIWYGPQKGISMGKVNRRLHFREDYETVIIEIEDKDCIVNFNEFPSFWRECPEIRIAKNKRGRNRLREFIEKRDLLPPNSSFRKRGKKDAVYLEVIEPYRRFRLGLTRRARVFG